MALPLLLCGARRMHLTWRNSSMAPNSDSESAACMVLLNLNEFLDADCATRGIHRPSHHKNSFSQTAKADNSSPNRSHLLTALRFSAVAIVILTAKKGREALPSATATALTPGVTEATFSAAPPASY